VLPNARDRAKDLGIINIAIVCPRRHRRADRGPARLAGRLPALFGTTAAVAIAGAIGVWQIKSVS
jgi:hypothetical protein